MKSQETAFQLSQLVICHSLHCSFLVLLSVCFWDQLWYLSEEDTSANLFFPALKQMSCGGVILLGGGVHVFLVFMHVYAHESCSIVC